MDGQVEKKNSTTYTFPQYVLLLILILFWSVNSKLGTDPTVKRSDLEALSRNSFIVQIPKSKTIKEIPM